MPHNTPDQSYAQGYRNLIYRLSQQEGSMLRGAVREEVRIFNVDFFERHGPTEVTEKQGRFADSPTTDQPHSRRRVQYKDWQHYPFLDKQEDQRLLIDPTSSYVRNGVSAFGRKMDDILIEAALGDAFAGQQGGTAVPLPAGQTIVAGGAGLTITKLRQTRTKLGLADVDKTIRRYGAVTSNQVEDLLEDTNITSSDFNTIRALVAGEVDSYMGFTFKELSPKLIPLASDIRSCVFWAMDGLILSIGDSRNEIVVRTDKSGAWQNQMDMALGSTRMEEAKIVEIECDES